MYTKLFVKSWNPYPDSAMYGEEIDVVAAVVDYVMNKLHPGVPYGAALKGREHERVLHTPVMEIIGYVNDTWPIGRCAEFCQRARGAAAHALDCRDMYDAYGLKLECGLGDFGIGGWARCDEGASHDLCTAQALAIARLCERDDVLQRSAVKIRAYSIRHAESYKRVEPLVREMFSSATPVLAIVKWRRFVKENDLVPRFFA